MIAYNCPIGRLSCDYCCHLTTGGCTLQQIRIQPLSVTHDEMVALYDRKKEALMKLSKEELVEILIGKREYVGMTFG